MHYLQLIAYATTEKNSAFKPTSHQKAKFIDIQFQSNHLQTLCKINANVSINLIKCVDFNHNILVVSHIAPML